MYLDGIDVFDGIDVAEDMAEEMAERPREAWAHFGIISSFYILYA